VDGSDDHGDARAGRQQVPADDLDVRLNGLTTPERDKVLSTNAAGVYNIPIK